MDMAATILTHGMDHLESRPIMIRILFLLLRSLQAIRRIDGGTELGTLGADAAEVGGRGFDAAHAQDFAVFAFELQPAAYTTIRTD